MRFLCFQGFHGFNSLFHKLNIQVAKPALACLYSLCNVFWQKTKIEKKNLTSFRDSDPSCQ